jgi:putative glutamine amidotransferase
MAPLIGVLCGYHPTDTFYFVKRDYIKAVHRAGGVTILLTKEDQRADITHVLKMLDGILVPGGPDVSPLFYGEDPIPEVTYSIQAQDQFEIQVVQECVHLNKPLFGICRGAQVINVALGGTLYQDIYSQQVASICHKQDMKLRSECTHRISVQPNTLLYELLGNDTLSVNSYHHQAIKDLADELTPSAWASDGIIEGIEGKTAPILAVQFHPENLVDVDSRFLNLFRKLVCWTK